MTIYDSYRPNKRAVYTPDMLPDDIYAASGSSINNSTTPYDSLKTIHLSFYSPRTDNTIVRDKPGCTTYKRG